MPKVVCAYKSCKNTKMKQPDLTFHRFPMKDPELLREWMRCSGNEDCTAKQMENKRLCCEHFLPNDFLCYGVGKVVVKNGCCPNDINGPVSDAPNSRVDCMPVDANTSNDFINSSNNLSFNSVSGNACNEQYNLNASVDESMFDAENESIHDFNRQSSSQKNESPPDFSTNPKMAQRSKRRRKAKFNKLNDLRNNSVKLIEANQKLLKRNDVLYRKNKILRQKIQRQLKQMSKPLTENEVLEGAEQYLNKNSLILLKMQLRHQNKKRWWDEDEKYFALSLYYKSPKAYKFLRKEKEISLPCLTIIKEWVNELTLNPGINTDLFKLLQVKAESMTEYEKECVLMWDEMTIRPYLEYNQKDDYIEGFADLGEYGRTGEQANVALVMMLSGLSLNWKQAVYFAFSRGTVPGDQLKKIILTVIDAVEEVGLKIRFMVCDQGAANQKAIVQLKITEYKPFIERHDRRIFFNYDTPHLLKCWRNNLINHDYESSNGTISWSAIRELRDLERHKSCKAVPKLTDRHIDPNNFQKMNVKLAVQVLSGSVARAMCAGHQLKELTNATCLETANFVWNMNDIFDCLNARHPNDRNPLCRGLSSKQPQVESTLRNLIPWIENIQMFDGNKMKYPDCFVNLVLTIKSILMFWEELREENRFYLLTGKLNQDPLENFFALMRSLSGCNNNPTAMQFRKNFQHGTVTTLLFPPPGANCKPDECVNLLSNIEANKKNKKREINMEEKAAQINARLEEWAINEYFDNDFDSEENETVNNDDSINPDVTLEKCAMKYVAGYLVHKCLNKFGCNTCRETLTRGDQNLEMMTDLLIFWKSYLVPEKELGNLKVPSEDFYSVIITAYEIFEKEFKLHYMEKNIGLLLKTYIEQVIEFKFAEFWLSEECKEHRNYILKLFVKLHIFYFLKWMSTDYRDSGAKRSSGSDSNKPHPKLQKLKK